MEGKRRGERIDLRHLVLFEKLKIEGKKKRFQSFMFFLFHKKGKKKHSWEYILLTKLKKRA